MMERTGFVDRLRQLALVAVIVVIARLSWEHAAPFCEELLGGVWQWFRPIAATTTRAWQGGGFWTRLQLAAVIAIILWLVRRFGVGANGCPRSLLHCVMGLLHALFGCTVRCSAVMPKWILRVKKGTISW